MKKALSLGFLLVAVFLLVAGLLASRAVSPIHGGVDKTGDKDGLMAIVGFDLASLYKEYEDYVEKNGTDQGFEPSNQFLRVIGNRVLIEAVALEDGASLESDLKELGMERTANFGRLVSGQLPIGAIKNIVGLPSLKSTRPAYAATRGGLTPIKRGD
ncbi:MAG: hypothetical protein J4O06_08300 [Chloroflexi bacterium]|nr:hypothetical protein [Chloroflexota bacterium]